MAAVGLEHVLGTPHGESIKSDADTQNNSPISRRSTLGAVARWWDDRWYGLGVWSWRSAVELGRCALTKGNDQMGVETPVRLTDESAIDVGGCGEVVDGRWYGLGVW